jgi:HSP20 family protein
MRLIRWNDPMTPFRSFEKLFEDFGAPTAVDEQKWLPAIDVTESEAGVRVRAEVPGMNADDLDISVHGDRLTIRGEKQDEKEEKGEQWHRVERYHGTFVRNVALPSPVDLEKIDAAVKDGVLTIDFHKRPEDKTRKINVKAK